MANLQIPLNIPDVEIINYAPNNKSEILITVKSTKKECSCHKCNKKIQKSHGYGETVVLRHTSIFDQPVYIKITLKRYFCDDCDSATTERPDWFTWKSKHTKAYEEYLMRMLIGSTIQDVARKEKLNYDEVEGSLKRQIKTEVTWDDFDEIGQLGIDEIALKKGHKNFVVIVSAYINGNTKIIAILPDRMKDTIKSFLSGIPTRLKNTIKTVCTDMYDGYINAVKEVLGGKVNIIIDRFHVARNYRKGVDTLRKQELKRLKKELTEEEYKTLKGAMWALRKKEINLTADDKIALNNIFKYSPDLKKAYDLQNELTIIFNSDYSKKQASTQISKWIKKVNKSNLNCFDRFIATLNKYHNEILNYFYRKGRKNSGFVEGLNNKIKTIKRRCYGIFNIRSLYQRIRLDLDGYVIYA